tara:strand:- start:181 stop:465 length:285 start_codon:yes stop_codon:yes gene_type:complete
MIENLTNVMTPKNNETEKIESQQETAEIELKKVLEMSLELYSTLLGYLIRVGNEMVRNRNPFYVNIFASLFSDFLSLFRLLARWRRQPHYKEFT